MKSLTPQQRRATLLGALVGDAVGVPYEFHAARDLPPLEQIDLVPPTGLARAHAGVPPGTWSDDGAQLLALLETLSDDPALALDRFGARLVNWMQYGHYTPDGIVFDVGIQTRAALSAIEAGTPADRSGPDSERSNGNGGLMRSIACLLAPFDDEAALVARAMRQCVPTHPHPRSQTVCALYVLTGWCISQGGSPEAALAFAQAQLLETLTKPHILELYAILEARDATPTGSGYVVDSFWSAWSALTSSNGYRDCIQQAIALGDDTDTTACIAGGLAGLLHGEVAIPSEWLDALAGRERALRVLEVGVWS